MSLPRQHVAESWQASEFYANKVLMEWRGKDDNQVAWVKGVKVRPGRWEVCGYREGEAGELDVAEGIQAGVLGAECKRGRGEVWDKGETGCAWALVWMWVSV